MDVSRNLLRFFILLQLFLFGKGLPCDELTSGNRMQCGSNVNSGNPCPDTCCFSDSSTNSECFFRDSAYGPIKHANGLCLNVENGAHVDFTAIIWSSDCTSSDAFFLVSRDRPPFHIASGKCLLPSNGRPDNPLTSHLELRSIASCKRDLVTYRPLNGNLEYYYDNGGYSICIGSQTENGDPKENERVTIPKEACAVNKACGTLSYVYQRKFDDQENAQIQCDSARTIKVVFASYGVLITDGQHPLTTDSSDTDCLSTSATNLMQQRCDGNTTCTFKVEKTDFGLTSCLESTSLLVHYTCKADAQPAAPNRLNVTATSQTELLVQWSNDAGTVVKFRICWTRKSGGPSRCATKSDSAASLSHKLSPLLPATQYTIEVERYSCDNITVGLPIERTAITRSAAINATGIKSSTSFEIKLGALQSDDMYVQVVVSRTTAKPTSHPDKPQAYQSNSNQPYITAEFDRNNFKELFTVGDGKEYSRASTRRRRDTSFVNVDLKPETSYSVFQRTFKSDNLYYDSDWMNVVKTDQAPPTPSTTTPSSVLSNLPTSGAIPDKPSGEGGSADAEKNDDGSGGAAIIGAAAGGAVVLIILVVLFIILIRRRRREQHNSNFYDKPDQVKYSNSKRKDNLDAGHYENPSLAEGGEENPHITAPSVYATPMKAKNKPAESVYQNGFQSDTYANMQVSADPSGESKGGNISRFLVYVEDMKKNRNFGFQNQFKDLTVGQVYPWDTGKKLENIPKNRYANTVAYDHSRVVLSGSNDYINANFITGVNSEVYIAAQGPTKQTVNDFWRMIWEQDSTSIIALTNLIELGKVKCVQYWADDETSFGEIRVKTVKTELYADYILRYIDIKKDGQSKRITQYHFTSWPDHGVPRYPTKLLAFRRRFRALHTVSTQPIVVHCSAGVGRTGSFIALDITLLRLNQLREQSINIFDTVKEMRYNRVNMVQTLEQYVLVHDAVLETVLCGFTEIEAENLKTEIERLEQKELNKSLTGFEIEFKKLASVCHPFAPEECVSALQPKNKSKNCDNSIYPSDNLRVFLCGSKAEEDPYINATYIHGYTQARAYIATQAPLPNTINDFWQMVFEKKTVVVVMLNNIKEGNSVYPQYWPEDYNQEQQYGDLFVKMLSAETRGPIISRKFVILNRNQNAAVSEHVIRHVQFTDWPEHEVPGNHNDIMDLLESVEEAQQRSANGVVIVHCSNGAHRTGTYLTLAIQRERVRSEHVIDIFRCIKLLREQRPQFVGNLEQYKFCYYAMLSFVESFKMYDNIPKVQKD